MISLINSSPGLIIHTEKVSFFKSGCAFRAEIVLLGETFPFLSWIPLNFTPIKRAIGSWIIDFLSLPWSSLITPLWRTRGQHQRWWRWGGVLCFCSSFTIQFYTFPHFYETVSTTGRNGRTPTKALMDEYCNVFWIAKKKGGGGSADLIKRL